MRRSFRQFALLGCCVLPLTAGCGGSAPSSIAPSNTQTLTHRSTLSAGTGGKPARFPFPSFPQTFPAGTACNFPLHIDPIVDKQFKKVYPPQPNGDFFQMVTGNFVAQLTNLGNGKSITMNFSGPQKILGHPNGTLDITLSGPTMVILFPFDVPPGPDTFAAKGRIEETFNVNTGVTTLVSETGTKTDLCAALS